MGLRSPRPRCLVPALSRAALQAALAAPRDFQSQLNPPPRGGGCLALVLKGDGVEAGVGGGFGAGDEGVLPSSKVTTCSKPSKTSSISR